MNIQYRQLAFLAALGLGTSWIVGVRELFPGLGGATAAAATCALIIIGGAVLYYRRAAAEAVDAADDFYYLGLLFTLVSLIHVLVRIFVFGDASSGGEIDNEQRTQQLIGNFGIALVSTVVGIVARVVLLGLHGSAERDDRRRTPARGQGVRTLVDDELLELRDQVRQAADAFSHFTRVTSAQAQDTKAHSERLMREFNARVDRLANERLDAMDDVASQWERATQTIQDQIAALAKQADERLAQAVEQANAAWQQLLERAEKASDEAGERLEAAARNWTDLLEGMRAVTQALGALDNELAALRQSAAAATATATESSTRIADAVGGMSEATAGVRSAQQEASAQITRLQGAVVTLNAVMDPLAPLAMKAAEGLRTLAPAADDAQSNVGQLRDALSETQEILVGAGDAFAAAGKKFESCSAALIDQLNDQPLLLGESLAKAIEPLSKSIQDQQALADQQAADVRKLLTRTLEERGIRRLLRWLGFGGRSGV